MFPLLKIVTQEYKWNNSVSLLKCQQKLYNLFEILTYFIPNRIEFHRHTYSTTTQTFCSLPAFLLIEIMKNNLTNGFSLGYPVKLIKDFLS